MKGMSQFKQLILTAEEEVAHQMFRDAVERVGLVLEIKHRNVNEILTVPFLEKMEQTVFNHLEKALSVQGWTLKIEPTI